MEQSEYVLEDFGDKKQISRFGSDGNRIVTIKVEAFDVDNEMFQIREALNLWINLNSYESKEKE